MGFDHVLVQEFPTTQAMVKRCEFVTPAGVLPLHPMRPNGIVPPVTPPGGITGRIYHAGRGRPEDFAGGSPRGCLVVLDYNCGQGWLHALRMGAAALIFVPHGTAQAWQHHYVENNVNIPRFYFNGPRGDLPQESEATIHSEVVWERTTGRNVFAFLPGQEPKFYLAQDEMMILAAHLDSFGEVPSLAPGARAAANCAGLLRIAARLMDPPPRRHLLFAFFDNQSRCHTGSSMFYRLFDRSVDTGKRLGWCEGERRFLDRLGTLVETDRPLRRHSDLHTELLSRTKSKAEEHVFALNEMFVETRRAAADPGALPFGAAHRGRMTRLKSEKRDWNDLRRALTRNRFRDASYDPAAGVRRCAAQALDEIAGDVLARANEVEEEHRGLLSDQTLGEWVGSHRISVHISLLMGDRTARWGVAIGGSSGLHWVDGDVSSAYLRIRDSFLSAWRSLGSEEGAAPSFEPATVDGTLEAPDLLGAGRGLLKHHNFGLRAFPATLVHSGEVGGGLGFHNLALCTVQEAKEREGTPDDRLELLDLERMQQQFEEIAFLVGRLADEPGLSQPSTIEARYRTRLTPFRNDRRGRTMQIMAGSAGSVVPDRPASGATIQFFPARESVRVRYFGYLPGKIYAFDDHQVLRSNHNGTYEIGPAYSLSNSRTHWVALKFDSGGMVNQASTRAAELAYRERLDLLRCRAGHLPCMPSPYLDPADVLAAATTSRLDPERSYALTSDGVISWFCPPQVDAVKVFGENSAVALFNGPEVLREGEDDFVARDAYQGVGLQHDTGAFPVALRSAGDLWRVNEARLQILRDKGIANPSIEDLHSRSYDLLLAAASEDSAGRQDALATGAFFSEGPVYREIRSLFNDLIRAILVLLCLCVPFAFALERLLVGSTSIYWQIFWFAAIFAGAFLILLLTHPAFTVSNTPLIIFLGFAVLTLSSVVAVMVMWKFEVELKSLQGRGSTVHATDVSRFGTIAAAVSMGISTMRRRPLRTGLTSITVIILTFTIVCFASFESRKGIVRYPLAPMPDHPGVFVHLPNWQTLDPAILNMIRGIWSAEVADTRTCPLYWRISGQGRGPLITREDGSAPLAMSGLIGLDPAELSYRTGLSRLLGAEQGQMGGRVWMTAAVAEELGVAENDRVLVDGLALQVGRILEPDRISVQRNMDGSDLLPLDTGSPLPGPAGAEGIERQLGRMTLPADSVLIVDDVTATRLGATLRAVTLYPPDTSAATSIAEDLARMLPMPIAATRMDGVYRHVLGTQLRASGVSDLFWPALLGGLVILGTMLGSVSDREQEIETFSALGLAPPHVAGLFFAEALVYSVIGGLGGYMLVQLSVMILAPLSAGGVVSAPVINYSSTNTVMALLIVMATVLVSAVYPAIKASRSANPGVLRNWRLPAPKGDSIDLVFPFTVSQYDLTGVVSFLKEHFDHFGDLGLGRFLARDTRLVRLPNDKIGLAAQLALAPFDLGVSQSFDLRSKPSEVQGIDEIEIHIRRTSGQPKDWRRLNKVLLNDLRRQFLIWRSLSRESMESYRQRTLEELGQF